MDINDELSEHSSDDEQVGKSAIPYSYAQPSRSYYPVLPNKPSVVAHVNEVLTASRYDDEFCLCCSFHPRLVVAAAVRGIFPMSISRGTNDKKTKRNLFFFAPKLHHNRCILKVQNFHLTRQVRKKAKQYRLTIDTNFDVVCQKIRARHGENWLCLPLERSFRHIYKHPNKYELRILSIELWHGEELAACELGYCVGAVYTSLTGCSGKDGAGTMQLGLTGALLYLCGFKIWDLGMQMPYKIAMGAESVPRQTWLALQGVLRNMKCELVNETIAGEDIVARFKEQHNASQQQQSKQ